MTFTTMEIERGGGLLLVRLIGEVDQHFACLHSARVVGEPGEIFLTEDELIDAHVALGDRASENEGEWD